MRSKRPIPKRYVMSPLPELSGSNRRNSHTSPNKRTTLFNLSPPMSRKNGYVNQLRKRSKERPTRFASLSACVVAVELRQSHALSAHVLDCETRVPGRPWTFYWFDMSVYTCTAWRLLSKLVSTSMLNLPMEKEVDSVRRRALYSRALITK